MSFRQIFSRFSRIARSYSVDHDRDRRGDALRRAEELIERENERWELDEERQKDQGGATKSEDAGAAHGATSGEMTIERAYHLLELRPGAAFEEVTRSYRRLILQHHPDRMNGRDAEAIGESERRSRELNEAYGFIKVRVRPS